MNRVIFALAAILLIAASVSAEEMQAAPYGFVQTWYSHASNGLDGDAAMSQSGFGLKRARLGVMLKGENFMGNVLVEGAGGFVVRDAYIDWYVNDMFTLTMGRFRGAGSQAAGLTSPIALDLPEYSLVGKNWAAGTVGADSRTMGMQVTASPTDIFELKALLHNGSGSVSYLPSAAAGAYPGTADTGFMPKLDLGAKAILWPGTELGFTYGMANENRRVWTAAPTDSFPDAGAFNADSNMSTHVHLNLGILFVKFEWANLKFKNDWDIDDDDVTASGYALTGGYTVVPQTDLVLRYDSWDADTEFDDNGRKNFSFGVNYSFSENPNLKYQNRVQLAYTLRMDETDRDDSGLVQLMWTYLIK